MPCMRRAGSQFLTLAHEEGCRHDAHYIHIDDDAASLMAGSFGRLAAEELVMRRLFPPASPEHIDYIIDTAELPENIIRSPQEKPIATALDAYLGLAVYDERGDMMPRRAARYTRLSSISPHDKHCSVIFRHASIHARMISAILDGPASRDDDESQTARFDATLANTLTSAICRSRFSP